MKPVYQTRNGGPEDPPEEAGDCFGACVASIFDLRIDEVLDRSRATEEDYEAWDSWFRSRGLFYQEFGAYIGDHVPPGYSLGWIPSAHFIDWGHFVVCKDGVPVHNPVPSHMEPEEYEPTDVDVYGVFCIVDPAVMLRTRYYR